MTKHDIFESKSNQLETQHQCDVLMKTKYFLPMSANLIRIISANLN